MVWQESLLFCDRIQHEQTCATGCVSFQSEITKNANQKNAVIMDPDCGYLILLFEPTFEDKAQQTGGYHGFTPV